MNGTVMKARGSTGAAPAAPAVGLLHRYLGLLGVVDAASRWILVGSMAALVVLVSANVAARYLLNESMIFATELSRLLFVWSIFLAIPHGLRRGSHVGIDLLVNQASPRVRDILFRLTSLLMLGLMAIVAWQGVMVAANRWDQLMPTLEMSAGWFYVPVAFCGLHSALHLMHHIWAGSVAANAEEVS